MDEKILNIIAITVPVFSLILIGKILGLKSIINKESKRALSWITYYLALPALILGVFLESDSSHLFTSEIFIASLIPVAVSALSVFLLLSPFKLNKEKKSAAIYCSYWGNNGYMGIPLVASAIGSTTGVAIAAVVNGMTVPFYIGISVFIMIRAKDSSEREHSVFKEVLKVFKNPVIITLFVGIILSFFKIPDLFVKSSNDVLLTFYEIILILTKKLGSMGLPLALILVGSGLNFKEIKTDRMLLSITILAKLVIAPLAVFLTVRYFMPNMDKNIFIALILLNAVPSAVASFIISARYKVAEDFVSSMLVLSTAMSVISIPIWLYFTL